MTTFSVNGRWKICKCELVFSPSYSFEEMTAFGMSRNESYFAKLLHRLIAEGLLNESVLQKRESSACAKSVDVSFELENQS